jgi:hypothetical protein
VTRGLPRAVAALVLTGAAGCSTAVLVDSDPRGALVVVDGVRGVTPFTARLPVTTFGTYAIRADKEGYETFEGELDRDANSTGIALSCLFPPAFLWSMYRAPDAVRIQLVSKTPFPEAMTHLEPALPELPPLSAGMTRPVKARIRPASAPEKSAPGGGR